MFKLIRRPRNRTVMTCALLVMVGLLACGPAAPQDANEPAGIVSPPTRIPQSDQPAEPASDPVAPEDPTATPIIFHAPTNTPRPTLIPDPPGAAEEFARNQAAFEAQAIAGQASVPPSTTEITQQARDFSLGYPDDGAIVRAEVTAHRVVAPNLDVAWPDRMFSPPYFFKRGSEEEYAAWRRSKLKINETYYGSLPQGYEIVAPEFAPNQALEVGKEYILYVVRYHVAEDELPSVKKIHRYNAEQLAALGGPAGLARLESNWVIDGDTAWKITEEYVLTPLVFTPVLTAAKAYGGSLPLVDLEEAIRAGIGNSDSGSPAEPTPTLWPSPYPTPVGADSEKYPNMKGLVRAWALVIDETREREESEGRTREADDPIIPDGAVLAQKGGVITAVVMVHGGVVNAKVTIKEWLDANDIEYYDHGGRLTVQFRASQLDKMGPLSQLEAVYEVRDPIRLR